MQIKKNQVVQSILKEFPNDIIIHYIKKQIVKRTSYGCEKSTALRAMNRLQLSDVVFLVKLKEKLNSLGNDSKCQNVKKEFKTLIDSLNPKYQKGDELLKIEEIEKITFDQDGSFTKENSEFKVEQGIIYLLVIWDANTEYCLARIDKYQSMLEKNPEWKGKVEIVCISVNERISTVIEILKQKNWQSIQNYRFLNGLDNRNTFIKYSQLQGTPFVMLINKKGRIDYLGYNPKEENFEERINKLIILQEDQEIQLVQKQQELMGTEAQGLLTKEEYKILRQQWKTLKQALKQIELKGKVKVVFETLNFFNEDGTKAVHQNPKFFLSYKVKVKEQPKICLFIDNYWNKLPENLRFVKKSKIINKARGTQDIKKKIQDIFQSIGVNLTYIPYCDIGLRYDYEKHEMILDNTEKFYVKANDLTIEQYQKGYRILWDDIMDIIYFEDIDTEDKLRQILDEISDIIGIKVGHQFQTIPNYKKWGSMEFTEIEHIPGQILVLYYWNKSKRNLGDIIFNNNNVKKIREKWGEAVRFVYLSLQLDEGSEDIMEKLQESLDYVDFYFPKENYQSDALQYNPYLCEVCVVVDKFGQVIKIESSFIEQQLIQDLINDKYIPELQEKKTVDFITQDTVDKVQNFLLSTEVQQKLRQMDKRLILEFKLYFEQTQVNGMLKFEVPNLYLICRDKQWEVVNQILEKIFEFIPEEYFKFSKIIHKTFSVPYPGSICSLCNKDILNEHQQYYSPFKKVHLCVECAEFEDKTKKGSDRYKCTDNLIFINGPLTDLSVLQNIDEEMIGKNLQLKEGEQGSQWHKLNCQGCKKDMDGPRYIAISQGKGIFRGRSFVDFCQDCFIILKDKNSLKAFILINQDAKFKIIEDNLFVRILFYHGHKENY